MKARRVEIMFLESPEVEIPVMEPKAVAVNKLTWWQKILEF